MKKHLLTPLAMIGLLAAVPNASAAQISLADYSLVPDGTSTTAFQNTNVNTLNGGSVLPTGEPKTVYVISTFNFGASTNAGLQWQFSVNETSALRLGVEIQNGGLVQFLGTGDSTRTTFNFGQSMAGQTVTLLAKLHYNANNNVTYGKANASDDTVMNVWVNPTSSAVEGSGLSAGNMSTIWNSAGFNWFRQTILNQNTPDTAGTSSITSTKILTGADATFARALATATGATPGIFSPTVSTVQASPAVVAADGATASTITVTITDAFGDPLADKEVTLARSPGNAVITPATAVTTNASGQAIFTVTSTTAGTEVLTATNVTDAQDITQTASVTFVSSADADLSTVVASPSYVNADGTTTSTITVTLKATGNAPVPNKSVTLAQTGGSGATITPATAQTSDANGQVVFAVSSSTPGAAEFTATVTTDSMVITQKGTVQFVGPGNASTSTVSASRSSVVADGVATSTITVTLKDAAGFPAQGKEITLAGSPGDPVISPSSATTNVDGVATFTVSSSTAGTEVFTATDTTDSVGITQTASVNFIAASIALPFNVNFVQFTPTLGEFEDPATLEGPAGGLGDTWNQFRAVSGSNLLAADDTATGVAVTTNFTECRQRSTGGLVLLKHGLTDFGKGLTRTVTISGLPPGGIYDVWLASTVNFGGTESAKGTFSMSNPTTTVGPQPIDQTVTGNITTWELGNNNVLFETVVVNDSGQIVISAEAAVDHRLPLSGIQLVPVGPALITSFGIPGWSGVINQAAKTISLTVPAGSNLATLAPTFTLSSGACNQTSGAPPSPTFAVQNPATYTVTDNSTEPPTINEYTVTVTVNSAVTSLVIDLGAGTEIKGGTYIGSGLANLPLPSLPPGSILRSISVDATLVATNNGNYTSDFAVLLDATPDDPDDDFTVEITNGTSRFGATMPLAWPASADGDVGTPLLDTKTDAAWATVGPIDLANTTLFLGNAFGAAPAGGTWAGTITLTYDTEAEESAYESWASGAPFDADKNGDGVANGLAFLLGAQNPDASALGLLPKVSEDASGLILTFSVLNAANRGPALASVQWSSDLGQTDPWATNSAAVPETTSTVNGVSFQVTPDGKMNAVVAIIPADKTAGSKLFARLAATEN